MAKFGEHVPIDVGIQNAFDDDVETVFDRETCRQFNIGDAQIPWWARTWRLPILRHAQ